MLESILATIEEVRESKPFPNFFAEYVLETQDENIEAEVRYLLTHNALDSLSVSRLLESTAKEVCSSGSFN